MTRPRFLVFGGSGFVGRHLYSVLGAERAITTYRSTPVEGGVYFDASNMRLRDVLRGAHGVAAAFLLHGITRLDECARDPAGTARVNVDGMVRLIDDLVDAGIKPLYASTDAVFDGSRGGWTEVDPPNPTLTYGRQKAAVEAHLRRKAPPWIIARLSKVVGSDLATHSLLGEWIRQIDAGETIRCATDLVFTPAHVDDVAAALIRLVDEPLSGVFNVCGPESMTRMELLDLLIKEVRRYRDVKPKVVACSIRDFPFLEPRPLDGSMVPTKLYRALGASFRNMRSVCAELARNRYGDAPAAADPA
jgi:dTDP-4-dehydrorhamnose reductase